MNVPDTPHLADLFQTGKETTIVYPGKPETKVWVERPNPDQQEECSRKARSARARRYYELMDEDSDERMALLQEADSMDKETLVEALMDGHVREIESRAYNDVLFSEDHGSNWGKEGEEWSGVIESLKDRLDEIDAHNEELSAAGAEEGILQPEDDPDIIRLSKVQDKFQEEVGERVEELATEKRTEIALNPIDRLRQTLIEDRVNLECDVVWFAAFKYEQLFRAVRFPKDHEKLYFKNVTQIKGLPRVVQEQLMSTYDEIDVSVHDLKNSLTPLPS